MNEICELIKDYSEIVDQIRVLRNKNFWDKMSVYYNTYGVLFTFKSKENLISFYKRYNLKPFSAFESELLQLRFIEESNVFEEPHTEHCTICLEEISTGVKLAV